MYSISYFGIPRLHLVSIIRKIWLTQTQKLRNHNQKQQHRSGLNNSFLLYTCLRDDYTSVLKVYANLFNCFAVSLRNEELILD